MEWKTEKKKLRNSMKFDLLQHKDKSVMENLPFFTTKV